MKGMKRQAVLVLSTPSITPSLLIYGMFTARQGAGEGPKVSPK